MRMCLCTCIYIYIYLFSFHSLLYISCVFVFVEINLSLQTSNIWTYRSCLINSQSCPEWQVIIQFTHIAFLSVVLHVLHLSKEWDKNIIFYLTIKKITLKALKFRKKNVTDSTRLALIVECLSKFIIHKYYSQLTFYLNILQLS